MCEPSFRLHMQNGRALKSFPVAIELHLLFFFLQCIDTEYVACPIAPKKFFPHS